jgi:ABC-2 type transport system permease protein
VNYVLDAFVQPILATSVEVVLWSAIFAKSGMTQINGFGPEYYLAYALWAATVGRISTNWMYEFLMVNDVDTGTLNSILVRPISFYEYYLAQFFGYKFSTAFLTFWLPAFVCWMAGFPTDFSRMPLMFVLVALNLIFMHTLSFTMATLAFHLNRSHAFTGIKNMILWVIGGELFPLDLFPEPLKTWVIHSPFANGVYIPVGYVTGRFGASMVYQGMLSLLIGTLVLSLIAAWAWAKGLRVYSGTGA